MPFGTLCYYNLEKFILSLPHARVHTQAHKSATNIHLQFSGEYNVLACFNEFGEQDNEKAFLKFSFANFAI
jgi:hypothetical protein